MTTTPFGASILDKMSSRAQACRWKSVFKEVRQFRAYCCNIDSDGIMGVAKEPVPIISISPDPACAGSAINWDISDSYAPGSTLTDWEIDFGDSSSDSGSDFPNDTTSGTHTYADPGAYEIVVTVEEGGGRTQTSTVQLIVVDCGEGEVLYTYLSTDGQGIYFIDWTADSPAWEIKGNGLTAAGLYVRSLTQNPATKHLPPSKHELWAATLGGIFVSYNGGDNWEQITMPDPSNAEFLDSPAAVVGELDWHKVVFDRNNPDVIYILAARE